MDSFVTFCESETKQIIDSCRSLSYHNKKLLENNNIIHFYEKWKQTSQKDINTVPLQCKETSYGLASMVSLGCPQCKEDARIDGRRRKGSVTMEPCKRIMENHKSKSELCQFDINIRFCLALQLMGKGGEHARILTSFLDLPEPHKWPRSFSVLEKSIHAAIEKVKCVSEEKAAEEEIILTDTPESTIRQTLIEEVNPWHRVEGSYDMGWQVWSSGGKYGSSTGHGLLISTLSKKVMDSVVYNKKCAICKENPNAVKKHFCVKNFEGLSKSMEASALTKMLIRLPEEKGVSICTIITDDDSNG
jgi:hypothetical protein